MVRREALLVHGVPLRAVPMDGRLMLGLASSGEASIARERSIALLPGPATSDARVEQSIALRRTVRQETWAVRVALSEKQ